MTNKHLLLLLTAERAEVERLNNNATKLADDKFAALALASRLQVRIDQLERLISQSATDASHAT